MDLEYLLEKEAGMDMPEEKIEEVELLELEEYLDNMGYITINQNDEDRVVDWKQIHEGIIAYRIEYEKYHPFFIEHSDTFKYTYDPAIASAAIAGELTEEELDFLAHVSSIEGEFNLHDFPQKVIKANPFLKRIINYRLSILGLVRTAKPTAYSAQISPALKKLGVWAGISDYDRQIEMIGDIHQLSTWLANRQQYPGSKYKQISYLQDKEGSLKGGRNKVRFKKKENFHFLTKDSKDAFKERGKKEAEMDIVIEDQLNQLMLRIIQVKLWCLGTYPGKLDSDIGSMSVQAIKDVIAYMREMIEQRLDRKLSEDESITIKDVLVRMKNKYWAINTTYFLGTVFPILLDKKKDKLEGGEANEEEEGSVPTTVSEELGTLVKEIPAENQDLFYTELNRLVDEKEESTVSEKTKSKKKRKVKTRGGRDLFRTVKRFFGNIIKSIARGIKFIINSIKKLFTWIKNGIKVLIREIKKVLALLRKGVQFIFGKKKITTKDESTQTVITTHYDADFDSVTRMNQAKPELIATHLAKNRDILLALQECSNFLGMALFIVVHITPPVGWLKLGIKLIQYLAGTRFKYQRFSFPGQ